MRTTICSREHLSFIVIQSSKELHQILVGSLGEGEYALSRVTNEKEFQFRICINQRAEYLEIVLAEVLSLIHDKNRHLFSGPLGEIIVISNPLQEHLQNLRDGYEAVIRLQFLDCLKGILSVRLYIQIDTASCLGIFVNIVSVRLFIFPFEQTAQKASAIRNGHGADFCLQLFKFLVINYYIVERLPQTCRIGLEHPEAERMDCPVEEVIILVNTSLQNFPAETRSEFI